MTNTTYRIGQPVKFIRNDGGASVLDRGEIVKVEKREGLHPRLTVTAYTGGEHTVLGHPDVVLTPDQWADKPGETDIIRRCRAHGDVACIRDNRGSLLCQVCGDNTRAVSA